MDKQHLTGNIADHGIKDLSPQVISKLEILLKQILMRICSLLPRREI